MPGRMDEGGSERWRISRRSALRAGLAGGAGLAAAALIGCGGDDEEAKAPAPGAGAATGAAAPAGPAAETDIVAKMNALAREDGAPYPYAYAEPPGEPKRGGTFVATISGFSFLDPNKSQSLVTLNVPNVTCDRLLESVIGPKMDKTKFELAPGLATTWEASPDGLRYTFHLRSGVKFHNVPPVDGRLFTAKDIVAVFERARTGISKSLLEEVDKITAPDDRTVVITLSKPNADFLIPLATRLFPIYPIELVDKNLIDKTAVGTGAMVLTEFAPDSGAKFKANPEFWDGKPYLDGFEFRVIVDAAAKTAAFRAGQIHFGAAIGNKDEAERLKQGGVGATLFADPVVIIGSNTVGFNPDNAKFTDDRVRRALSLAADRQRMIQTLYQGYGKTPLAHGWTFVFDKFPTPEQFGKYWRYDPAEAKKLLAAAGQEKLEFTTFSANTTDPAPFSLIADMWREVGVNMRLSQSPYAQFVEAFQFKKYPESSIVTPLGTYPAANSMFYDYMHSKVNYWRINDPKIDAWAEQQRVELNPQVRRETLRKMWDLVQDRVFKIETTNAYVISALNPAVRYMRFNGPYYNNSTVYDWGKYLGKTWLDK